MSEIQTKKVSSPSGYGLTLDPANGAVTVDGSVTATSFIGNGSGLTGVTGDSSLGTNGYQKLASGFTIQWGFVYAPAAGTVTVTLPVAHSLATYSATIGNKHTSAAGSGGSFGYVHIISNSQISITNDYSSTNSSRYYYWITLGV